MDKRNALWEQNYKKLVSFKQLNGHTLVPQDFKEDKSFAKWVATQRYWNKKGVLGEDKVKKLDELGFVWDVGVYRWNKHYKALKEFKKENGHIQVPFSFIKDEISLGKWLSTQRKIYKQDKLSEDRAMKLKQLSAIWDMCNEDWEQGYGALFNFKKKYGHCDVTRKRDSKEYKYNKLANWVQTQRQLYKKNMLDKKQIKQLEELGFVWVVREKIVIGWEGRYKMLVDFYNQHGHFIVPRGKEEYKSLGNWVNQQRKHYRNKTLSKERIQKLKEIGFVWTVRQRVGWEGKYQMLVNFRNQHGHCLVPIGEKEYTSLANWVKLQRTAYRNETLSDEKIQKLEELGFVWTRTRIRKNNG